MDPSTLGSTRRSATVAIEASEATSEALSTSSTGNHPCHDEPRRRAERTNSEEISTGPAY